MRNWHYSTTWGSAGRRSWACTERCREEFSLVSETNHEDRPFPRRRRPGREGGAGRAGGGARRCRRAPPPVLTLQGELDPLVRVEQARTLHAALKKAGVPEQLIIVAKAGQGWGGEDRERTNRAVID